jgi:hypothetical protein
MIQQEFTTPSQHVYAATIVHFHGFETFIHKQLMQLMSNQPVQIDSFNPHKWYLLIEGDMEFELTFVYSKGIVHIRFQMEGDENAPIYGFSILRQPINTSSFTFMRILAFLQYCTWLSRSNYLMLLQGIQQQDNDHDSSDSHIQTYMCNTYVAKDIASFF